MRRKISRLLLNSFDESRVRRLIARFVCEECGQDVIEYSLLGAFIGTVGILTWFNIGQLIGLKYASWDSNVQGLWVPPDPMPSGS